MVTSLLINILKYFEIHINSRIIILRYIKNNRAHYTYICSTWESNATTSLAIRATNKHHRCQMYSPFVYIALVHQHAIVFTAVKYEYINSYNGVNSQTILACGCTPYTGSFILWHVGRQRYQGDRI